MSGRDAVDIPGQDVLACAALALDEQRVDFGFGDVLDDLEDLATGVGLRYQIDFQISLSGLPCRLDLEMLAADDRGSVR